jgi:hypothetical protein
MRQELILNFDVMVRSRYFSLVGWSISVHSSKELFLKINRIWNVVALVLFSVLAACAHAVPFEPHTGTQPMQSYLAMNLPYEHFQKSLQVVEQHERIHLKNRGEAHITVVSPVEYDNVLKRYISIEEINAIALKYGMQQLPIQEICIGRGQKLLQGKPERTYFVVVSAPGLIKIRELIAAAYVAHGGQPQSFRPDVFFPHVTLGFTARDLHFEDGVIKNYSSCFMEPLWKLGPIHY